MNSDRPTAFSNALIVALLASILITIDIARGTFVVGSPDGGWVYGYLQPLRMTPILVAALATAIACLALIVCGGRVEGRIWQRFLLWSIVGVTIQVLIRSLAPFSLEQIFVSEGANSFYTVTRRYYASTVLREFDTLRASWPQHAQSNMPGKLMLIYALKDIARASSILPWLVIGVSNLGVFPMYWFARDLFGDARIALWSAALYLIVPAKLFFFPLMNTVTPVIVLTCACLVMRWLATGKTVYATALGAALYGLVFFEPTPLVVGIVFATLLVRAIRDRTISWRQGLWQSLAGISAFVVMYLIVRRWTGFNLLTAFSAIGADAVEFNRMAGRPYGIWVWQNPWDFAIGMGTCQAVLAVAVLWQGLVECRRTGTCSAATWLSASLLGSLLAIDLLGVNRGEVVRLWIFLACFLQIPAAYFCARLDSRVAFALVLAVTIFQGALGTAMIGFVLPG